MKPRPIAFDDETIRVLPVPPEAELEFARVIDEAERRMWNALKVPGVARRGEHHSSPVPVQIMRERVSDIYRGKP